LDGRVIDKLEIRNLEGSDHGLIEILSQHLSGMTEKYCEIPQSGYAVFRQMFQLNTSRNTRSRNPYACSINGEEEEWI
jgi:hypothetical protein